MILVLQACFFSLGLFHQSQFFFFGRYNIVWFKPPPPSPRQCEPHLSFHRSKKKTSCRYMRFQYFRIVKFVCTLENELKGLFVYFLQRFARSPSLTPKCSCGKLNLTFLGKLISNKTFHYSGFYDLLNQS